MRRVYLHLAAIVLIAGFTSPLPAQSLKWATGYPKEGSVAGYASVKGTCSNSKITKVFVWAYINGDKKGAKGLELGVDLMGNWGVNGTNVAPLTGKAGDVVEIFVEGSDGTSNYAISGSTKTKS